MKFSADSTLAVINDILDFSKIEAGRLELDPVAFNLRDHVEEAARVVAVKAHEKGLELTSSVHTEVPEFLVGDVTRLRQILVNLLGNAVKFTEKGEVSLDVDIASREPGKLGLHFAVRDTGIGVPKEKQDQIFDAFTQGDGSTTRKYGGTGLGLTISSRLVKAMNGKIWVESEPGRGSVFHFTAVLGLAQESAAAAREEIALRGTRVLVVDDNQTNRRILSEMLRAWGMDPDSAEDAGEALARLRRGADQNRPFRLVLTDVHMPEMDGFQLVERIVGAPDLTHTFVLMLTSGDRLGDIARCRELGVAAFLTKPVRRAELRTAICNALANRPLGKAINEAPAEVQEKAVKSPESGGRILLAEDNSVNQRVARAILEKAGHSVVVAGNGLQALESWETQPFDVILMDVQMPEMDGFEATAMIRNREKRSGMHTPIIAMTAHAMTGDRERCLNAGMDNYISKPINSRELLGLISTHLKSAPKPTPA